MQDPINLFVLVLVLAMSQTLTNSQYVLPEPLHENDKVVLNCSAEKIDVAFITANQTDIYYLAITCTSGKIIENDHIKIYNTRNSTDSGDGYIAIRNSLNLTKFQIEEGSECNITGEYNLRQSPGGKDYTVPSQTCTIPELQLNPPILPESVSVTEGEDLNVNCSIDNPDRLGVTQVWVDSDGNELSTNATLTVENITRNYSGVTYTCVFTDVRNRSLEANTTVEVQYAPEVIILQPSTLSPLLVGEDLFLSCGYDGVPTPNITWLHNGTELENVTGKVLITIMDGLSNLTVRNFSESDVGEYTCEAINGVGNDSDIITMEINSTSSMSTPETVQPTTQSPPETVQPTTQSQEVKSTLSRILLPFGAVSLLIFISILSIIVAWYICRRRSRRYSNKYHFNIYTHDKLDLHFEPVSLERKRKISLSMETVYVVQAYDEHDEHPLKETHVMTDVDTGLISEDTSLYSGNVQEGEDPSVQTRSGAPTDQQVEQCTVYVDTADHNDDVTTTTRGHGGYIGVETQEEGHSVVDIDMEMFVSSPVPNGTYVHSPLNTQPPCVVSQFETLTKVETTGAVNSGYVVSDSVEGMWTPPPLHLNSKIQEDNCGSLESEQSSYIVHREQTSPLSVQKLFEHSESVCTAGDATTSGYVDMPDEFSSEPNDGIGAGNVDIFISDWVDDSPGSYDIKQHSDYIAYSDTASSGYYSSERSTVPSETVTESGYVLDDEDSNSELSVVPSISDNLYGDHSSQLVLPSTSAKEQLIDTSEEHKHSTTDYLTCDDVGHFTSSSNSFSNLSYQSCDPHTASKVDHHSQTEHFIEVPDVEDLDNGCHGNNTSASSSEYFKDVAFSFSHTFA